MNSTAWSDLLTPFTSHAFLLRQLVERDIKARYKQSVLGYSWVILNPLLQVIMYTFVFSVVFRFETPVPYPLFLFVVFLPWMFLQNAVLSATNVLVSHANLLNKVAFPCEILVYATVIARAIDTFVAMVLLGGLFIWYGVLPAASVWLVPGLLVILVILGTGLSLCLAALNLLFRDVQYVSSVLLTVWFYLTPIVYSLELVPTRYQWLYRLNPLVGLVENLRAATFGQPLIGSDIGWAVFVSLVVFGLSWQLFKHLERIFADVV